MISLESDIEKKLVRWAKRKRLLMPKLNTPGQAGYPDRMLLLPNGKVVFIELKRPGEEPEPLQFYYLASLRNLGYCAFWSDNYEECVNYLEWHCSQATRVPKTRSRVVGRSRGRSRSL